MKRIRGFSLIEMAVVLVILGLALGGLLMPLSQRLEESARKETRANLQTIKQALIGFAMTNGRLPCPDTNGDGLENMRTVAGNTVCDQAYGELPHGILGVGMEDTWRRPYSYFVSPEFADLVWSTAGGTCTPNTAGISFAMCSNGVIDVHDGGGNTVASQVPAVIVSHGKGGNQPPSLPGRGAGERTNHTPTNGGSAVLKIQQNYSDTPGAEYDDLVEWIPPTVLKARMVAAGKLP